MSRKSKQKLKHKKEDNSKIVGRVEEEPVGAKGAGFSSDSCACERERHKCVKFNGRKVKSSKQVHFSVLPDKYEPLEEDTASDTAREDTHGAKHGRYKRFGKNFRKAFRYTWKCLVIGLQSFSLSYSGPLSAASTLVPEMHRTSPKA